MAVRGIKYVSESIWLDSKYRRLNTEEKLLFLYLLTSTHVEQAGIYEIPYDVASFEIGLDKETVKNAMDKLTQLGLIDYDDETEEVAVLNYLKYNLLKGGENIKKCLMSLSKKITSVKLMESMYNKLRENKDERDIYQFAILCYETYLNYKKTGEIQEIPDEENPYSPEYREYHKKNKKNNTTKSESTSVTKSSNNNDDDPHRNEEIIVIETENDVIPHWVESWRIKEKNYQAKRLFFPMLGEKHYKVFKEEELANIPKKRYW